MSPEVSCTRPPMSLSVSLAQFLAPLRLCLPQLGPLFSGQQLAQPCPGPRASLRLNSGRFKEPVSRSTGDSTSRELGGESYSHLGLGAWLPP